MRQAACRARARGGEPDKSTSLTEPFEQLLEVVDEILNSVRHAQEQSLAGLIQILRRKLLKSLPKIEVQEGITETSFSPVTDRVIVEQTQNCS
jgi:hypothetical protein